MKFCKANSFKEILSMKFFQVNSGPADSGPVNSGPADSGPVNSGPADSGQ